jgi:hypothetical protein
MPTPVSSLRLPAKFCMSLNPEIPPRFRTFLQIYSASLGLRRFNVIFVGCFANGHDITLINVTLDGVVSKWVESVRLRRVA